MVTVTYMFHGHGHVYVPWSRSPICSMVTVTYMFNGHGHLYVPWSRSRICSMVTVTYMFRGHGHDNGFICNIYLCLRTHIEPRHSSVCCHGHARGIIFTCIYLRLQKYNNSQPADKLIYIQIIF